MNKFQEIILCRGTGCYLSSTRGYKLHLELARGKCSSQRSMTESVAVPPGMDPVFYAMNRLRRGAHAEATTICSSLLEQNPRDVAVFFLKTRALAAASYVDDTEMEEEGVGDLLMDDNAMAAAPRPGTSLARPAADRGGAGGGVDAAIRPVSSSGRPMTGFARPGSAAARPGTGAAVTMEQALSGTRPGTSRPMTMLGRQVRLGTASMATAMGDGMGPGTFIDVDRLDLKRYAARPPLAKALCDFLLRVEHNPKKALELAAAATVVAGFTDWWWKTRLGKCYYALGLLREAEAQFKSSLREQSMVITALELGKVYLKLDQPLVALDVYDAGARAHPGDVSLLLATARVYDLLGDGEAASAAYKRVLRLDPSSVEAMASLAANHFYQDQPEIALRFYRRLLQMGCASAELHNNLGLSCFHASQYDMALSCFERALALADDTNTADVWYNVGQVAVGIGDLALAAQAFKVAVSVDGAHAESFNNLGVLEQRKGNVDVARNYFQTAQSLGAHMYEPHYNSALLSYKAAEFEESFTHANKAKAAFAGHSDTTELLRELAAHFGTI